MRPSPPDEWMVCPIGDTDFEKGVRRGIELVLATISRWHHGPIDLYQQDDGSYADSHADLRRSRLRQDFARTIDRGHPLGEGR